MRKNLIKSDYYFLIVIFIFIGMGLFRQFRGADIQENGISVVAKVVSINKVYKQGLFLVYQYSYNGKSYSNKTSISSRKVGEKYLNKFFEAKVLEDAPNESLIYLEEEIKK